MLLARAAGRIGPAPDLVLALSRHGRRTLHTTGTAPPPEDRPRDRLRYELGSASKTFTGLLLARLVAAGRLSYDEPAAELLAPGLPVHRSVAEITLRHLITHTSGLPGLPAGFYPQAVPRWTTAPYAGYPADRVVRAFLRARPRHAPGTRWHYSNFAVAVLAHALAAATDTPWDVLVHREVLAPLHLGSTSLAPGRAGADARGHLRDGTAVPVLDIGGFAGAGAVRSTPHDLLTFLEAHLAASGAYAGTGAAGNTPFVPPPDAALAGALARMRHPVLRRGPRHTHTHTLTWFQHASPHGPVNFHAGATPGQQAFLGYCPDTGTALAAVCTRRVSLKDPFVATAHGLLTD
ncbi:serine hydrolase [Streptomyces sp. NBC_00102]|uniref:serine hydrolase domain-containing protein n=1 Tax=Streptomyces sp. NBC_00102 TaxID=2975652 RepID=UPI0022507393|nr:serine hydrolase domain-containing protein [Streptomyces sp. NBC_00102]MCX5399052.1 beta-lactamase family protein [Streptomyces sp. NBC_00102]